MRSGEHVVRDLGWESRSREERQADAAARQAQLAEKERKKQAALDKRAQMYDEGVDLLAQLTQERRDELDAEEVNFARGMGVAAGGDGGREEEAGAMDVDVDENATPKVRQVSFTLLIVFSGLALTNFFPHVLLHSFHALLPLYHVRCMFSSTDYRRGTPLEPS